MPAYYYSIQIYLWQKQKYKLIEQDRKPRNKPMQPMGTLFLTKETRMGQREPLQ